MKITFVLPDFSLTPLGGFRSGHTCAYTLAHPGQSAAVTGHAIVRVQALSLVMRVQILRGVLPRLYAMRPSTCSSFQHAITTRYSALRMCLADVGVVTIGAHSSADDGAR